MKKIYFPFRKKTVVETDYHKFYYYFLDINLLDPVWIIDFLMM